VEQVTYEQVRLQDALVGLSGVDGRMDSLARPVIEQIEPTAKLVDRLPRSALEPTPSSLLQRVQDATSIDNPNPAGRLSCVNNVRGLLT
jgi:hypothetical protein